MKKSNSTKKALGAFKKLGAVALITATMFFTACNQAGGGGGEKPKPTPTPTKYTVTLTQTANGNVTASHAIPQDGKVDENTIITFTATANEGYKIGKWTVTGSVLEANTGADGSKTAKVKITADTQVSVSFEAIKPTKYTVTLNQTEHGTVTASHAIPQDGKVDENTVITFTATANEGYKIGKWTVTGSTLETGTGADGSKTAKVKITADTTVSVSFEAIPEGAILTLAADKDIVAVMAKTADGTDITVVGCTETTLTSGNQKDLHANGATITLKGNIIELHVNYNFPLVGPLTALDVSGLAKLKKLNCGGNQLTTLNASGLTGLKEIKCYSNKLTELNVQGCTALQKLECSSNDLPELNVKGLTQLQELACPNNKLTELDVRGLTVLKNLRCNQNKLTSLNVKGLTALEELDCRGNNLATLDVGLTKLKNLDCDENKLETLDASGLTELKTLNCNENQLTKLNVQGCTALKTLYCHSNQLDAKAMTELLNALPQREASEDNPAIALLYTEETGKTEGNHKDFNTPDDLKTAFEGAKSRKWKLQKVNAGGYDYVDI